MRRELITGPGADVMKLPQFGDAFGQLESAVQQALDAAPYKVAHVELEVIDPLAEVYLMIEFRPGLVGLGGGRRRLATFGSWVAALAGVNAVASAWIYG